MLITSSFIFFSVAAGSAILFFTISVSASIFEIFLLFSSDSANTKNLYLKEKY